VFTVRLYQKADEAAVRDICLRTGDVGGDATGMYRDRDLLSDIYAIPYTLFDPDLAFVAEDGGRVVGYILGTADTPRFVGQYRGLWLPQVADRHAPPPEVRPDWNDGPEDAMLWRLHHPEEMLEPSFAGYPAHLHIDLLPEAQGRGGGRALMTAFLAAARAAAPRGCT
jgi:GNAT superfamily N-acetyltransferase